MSLAAFCAGSAIQAAAQTTVVNPKTNSNKTASVDSTTAAGKNAVSPRMRSMTNAQRKMAAANAARRRSSSAARGITGMHANAIAGLPGAGSGVLPDPGTLYFGSQYPNYATSPLPNPSDSVNCGNSVGYVDGKNNYCGIRKFVDTLPLPNVANDLGMMMPVAVPDTKTFPGSDYYEITLQDYYERMHQDLPATRLRGYVQTNLGTDPNTGANTVQPAPIHYMGPLIIATSNRPVRVKFINGLGSAATTGALFVPEDTTVKGSGLGLAKGEAAYLDNRATVHLHGGATPWISDGTPHQWTVPAVDSGTTYPRGDSVQFVPDMFFVNGVVVPQCGGSLTINCSDPTGVNNAVTLPPGATNDPGPGNLDFYYTNQQSARLMFYHDHALGTTRLNVYVGEAAGYLLQDAYEADLVNGSNVTGVNPNGLKVLPDVEIPLVIQDKSFVPQNPTSTGIYSVPVLESGSGYTAPTVSFGAGCAVAPTATADFGLTTDPFGQYIDGALLGITLTSSGSGCTKPPAVTISDPTGTGAAAFAYLATLSQQDPTWDSAKWGGYGQLWYPHVYMPNQWPNNPDGSGANPMGRWDYAAWFWPAFTNQYQVRGEIACTNPGDGTVDQCPGTPTPMNPGESKDLAGGTALGVGSIASLTPEAFVDTPIVNGTAYPVLTVDPKPYRFRILSVGNDRTFNLSWFRACGVGGYTPNSNAVCPAPPTGLGIATGTEVAMVPAVPNSTPNYPPYWPTDGRDGGVPDPAAAGPSWIAIGNEGGFLPAPAVIPAAPVNYEYDRRSVTVTNTSSVSLELMPAERADVIVDFTKYAGQTLILYNDAPAPNPAFDSRYDYYTNDPDQTGVGGAPTTLAGFGPNTRTVMQVKVNSSITGTPAVPVNMANLNTLLPAVFKASQPVPIVPEPVYTQVYHPATPYKSIMPVLGANTVTFTPIGATAPITMTFGQKAIQELFELDYGRMNATLGTEIQLTTYNNQTTIPLGYVDPFTEDIYDSANVIGQPVGVAGDGTQIWEVIHNGVDSHAIHFHLYNVQVIDRVGWDGTLRSPLPIELGWKDTVRMNPLEIDFVALRPVSPTMPFPLPDSVRLLDPTRPAGVTDPDMSTFGPTNAAFSQTNSVVPMGWEYVWHCHILGHEENDMMREQVFQVPPQTPANLTAQATRTGNVLSFVDKSLSEAGFDVQRADDALFTSNVTLLSGVIAASAGWNGTVTWKDTSAVVGDSYFYRVRSEKPDADYWNTPLGGAPLPNLVSGWSNVPTLQASAGISVNPLLVAFGNQPYLTTSGAQTVVVTSAGLLNLKMSQIGISGTNASDFAFTSACPITPGSLAVNATCNISVTFTPKYAGLRVANLVINSNDPGTPALSIPLTGNGGLIPLTITASGATVNWGTGVPIITPNVNGLVSPDTTANLGALTCSTTYTATSNAGTYPSSCTGAVNAAYNITYVRGSVIVNRVAAAMISPTPGTTLTGASTTFTWTTGGAAQSYALLVGTGGAGSANLLNTAWVTTTSRTVTLPTTGVTAYVRLSTLVNGVVKNADYTYMLSGAPAPAAMISPVPGTTLTAANTTFTWSAGNGATSYRLFIGTTGVGSSNVSAGTWSANLTSTATLPTTGITLNVRLWSLVNGVQQYVDYTYTAPGTPAPATLLTPTPGSTLASTTQTFTWTTGNGADWYVLYVGTTGAGSSNLVNSKAITATTYTANNLPSNGATLYIRLFSHINGAYQYIDYTVKAF